jgi:hypothetical protein
MEATLDALKTQGVQCTVHEHPAVLTAEEQETHIAGLPGAHVKNLLVSDKKHGARAPRAPRRRQRASATRAHARTRAERVVARARGSTP